MVLYFLLFQEIITELRNPGRTELVRWVTSPPCLPVVGLAEIAWVLSAALWTIQTRWWWRARGQFCQGCTLPLRESGGEIGPMSKPWAQGMTLMKTSHQMQVVAVEVLPPCLQSPTHHASNPRRTSWVRFPPTGRWPTRRRARSTSSSKPHL